MHNEKIGTEIFESTCGKMHDEIKNAKLAMKQSDLNIAFGILKETAMQEVRFWLSS